MVATASKVISFRVPASQWALLDRAAKLSGKTRSAFLLEAVCEKAHTVLGDQMQFALSRQDLQRFNALIEVPLANTGAISRLMATPAPWER